MIQAVVILLLLVIDLAMMLTNQGLQGSLTLGIPGWPYHAMVVTMQALTAGVAAALVLVWVSGLLDRARLDHGYGSAIRVMDDEMARVKDEMARVKANAYDDIRRPLDNISARLDSVDRDMQALRDRLDREGTAGTAGTAAEAAKMTIDRKPNSRVLRYERTMRVAGDGIARIRARAGDGERRPLEEIRATLDTLDRDIRWLRARFDQDISAASGADTAPATVETGAAGMSAADEATDAGPREQTPAEPRDPPSAGKQPVDKKSIGKKPAA
jgi:hypothetical protein